MRLSKTDLSIWLVSKIGTISWLFFLGLFFLGPISYPFNPNIFYILCYFLVGFFAGILLLKIIPIRLASSNAVEHFSPPLDTSFLLNVTGILTVVYLLVIGLDFLVLGNVLEVGITNSREELTLEGRRGSILGMLNILLSGMPVVLAGFLILGRSVVEGHIKHRILIFLSIIGFSSFFLSGGRNFFVISLIILFFIFYLDKYRQSKTIGKLKYSFKALLFLMIFFGVGFVLYLFVERAELRNDRLIDSVIKLTLDFDVKLNPRLFENDLFNDVYLAFISLFFYANHSLSLFSEYLLNSNYSSVGNGSITFPLFFMLFDKLPDLEIRVGTP